MGGKLQRCLLLSVFLFLTTIAIQGPSTTYAINLRQLFSTDVSVCVDAISNVLTSIACETLVGTINPTSQCCLLLVRASACGTHAHLGSIPPSSFTTAQLEILSKCGVESIPVPVASPTLAPTPTPTPIPSPNPTPTPTPTQSPTSTPTATPIATPTPTTLPSPTPAPTIA